MPTSTGPTVKAALVAALTTAYAADSLVRVFYGHPGPARFDDMVAVMGVTSEQQHGPMGGTRPREETLRVTVVLSCYTGGGTEVQQTVTERAFALLGSMETALRTDPTLAGTCRWAQIESYESVEVTDPDIIETGRVTEIFATVLVQTRI